MRRKRKPLDLIRHLDDDHPTVSCIAPLVCFVSIFTLLILFRLVSIFGAVTARCVETDQFWYTSTEGNWPLVASFFLALFLLFVWNVFIAFDDWNRSKGTNVMIVVNTLAIVITLYTFNSLHDSAYFSYHTRNGYYDAIKFNPYIIQPRWTESRCDTYRRFAGRWRVVYKEVGHYQYDVASLWIELHPWGKFHAVDERWQSPYVGTWQAPYQSRGYEDEGWREGYIYSDKFGAPWDFDLQGDTLTLTTPEYFNEWERSKVILERDTSE